MELEKLIDFGISQDLIDEFKKDGMRSLYPPQSQALRKGLLEGKSLVLSCPTASGKTFIATLAIINALKNFKGKVLYVVPLIALANEKYNYYKNFKDGYFKAAVSIGDLDSNSPWLSGYELIVSTTEKLDSLIRHGSSWMSDISLIIVDEIHLINDPSRGPTLEVLICRLRELNKNAQILGLSATISNAVELAEWLGADLVESEFRPVKLYEGFYANSKINFLEKIAYRLTDDQPEIAIMQNTLIMKKQALFFVSTRRSAESLAEKITLQINVSTTDKKALDSLSREALSALEVPTHQCKRLALCLKHGVAFHHAGLVSKQRRLIEDNFRSGLIRFIVATPTLAMGVNLPAFRVVIRDIKRYYAGQGSVYIPILEYKQFVGRAGRPQYDEFGESIIVSKSLSEAEELVEHYIKGKPENIESKLAQESILRMHTLSLIAGSVTKKKESILGFFSKTFFGHQYEDINLIESKIDKILSELIEWGFVEGDIFAFGATRLGRRMSELYIDPLTAHNFIVALKKADKIKIDNFSILQLICQSDEIRPLITIKANELPKIEEVLAGEEDLLLADELKNWDMGYESFLESVKMAMCFGEWINEETEDYFLEEFKITPGELHSKLEIADWLLYCLQEIAVITKYSGLLGFLRKLRVRLSYGIKEELVDLVRLRGIGRVRSRKLFKAGIRNLSALKDASLDRLSDIIGSSVAKSVKEQLSKNKSNKENQAALAR